MSCGLVGGVDCGVCRFAGFRPSWVVSGFWGFGVWFDVVSVASGELRVGL